MGKVFVISVQQVLNYMIKVIRLLAMLCWMPFIYKLGLAWALYALYSSTYGMKMLDFGYLIIFRLLLIQ